MKATITAACFGTSLLPATKAHPKEMLPVYDRPTLQYLVEETVSSGIDDILIITGKTRNPSKTTSADYELEYTLQRAGKDHDLKIRKITELVDICYVRQKHQKGLGDAIKCVENHAADETFAVLLGYTITKSSTPCTKQLMNVYDKLSINTNQNPKKQNKSLQNLTASKVEDKTYKITERFKKNPTNLAVMGRCILTPEIFERTMKLMWPWMGNPSKRCDGETGFIVWNPF